MTRHVLDETSRTRSVARRQYTSGELVHAQRDASLSRYTQKRAT